MFIPGSQPKIRPKLVHPSHDAVFWSLDLNSTKYEESLNVLTDVHYDDSNPIIMKCQYKIPKFDSFDRLQNNKVQGVFVKAVTGHLIVHRDDAIVKDGAGKETNLLKKGVLLKKLIEIPTQQEIIMNAFIVDVIPVAQYDKAYLYKIIIEDRELDQTDAQPITATNPELGTPATETEPEVPQVGPIL